MIRHMEIKDVPIVYCEVKGEEDNGKLVIMPNYGGGEYPDSLKRTRDFYKTGIEDVIFIKVNNRCIGISIESAKEVIETLQSMVKFITEEE